MKTFMQILQIIGVSCLLLLYSTIIVLGQNPKQDCIRKAQLDNETIYLIETYATNVIHTVPEDNTKLNDYFACYFVRRGLQNKDGEFDWKVMSDQIILWYVMLKSNHPKFELEKVKNGVNKALRICARRRYSTTDYGRKASQMKNCFYYELDEFFIDLANVQ